MLKLDVLGATMLQKSWGQVLGVLGAEAASCGKRSARGAKHLPVCSILPFLRDCRTVRSLARVNACPLRSAVTVSSLPMWNSANNLLMVLHNMSHRIQSRSPAVSMAVPVANGQPGSRSSKLSTRASADACSAVETMAHGASVQAS